MLEGNMSRIHWSFLMLKNMNHKFQLLAESDLDFLLQMMTLMNQRNWAQRQDLDSQTYMDDGFGVVQSDSPKNSANSMGTQQINKKWLQPQMCLIRFWSWVWFFGLFNGFTFLQVLRMDSQKTSRSNVGDDVMVIGLIRIASARRPHFQRRHGRAGPCL